MLQVQSGHWWHLAAAADHGHYADRSLLIRYVIMLHHWFCGVHRGCQRHTASAAAAAATQWCSGVADVVGNQAAAAVLLQQSDSINNGYSLLLSEDSMLLVCKADPVSQDGSAKDQR
jgi:hypothetical protein